MPVSVFDADGSSRMQARDTFYPELAGTVGCRVLWDKGKKKLEGLGSRQWTVCGSERAHLNEGKCWKDGKVLKDAAAEG